MTIEAAQTISVGVMYFFAVAHRILEREYINHNPINAAPDASANMPNPTCNQVSKESNGGKPTM